MWSSSRRRPSGKRIPCSTSRSRRKSLCGVSRPSSFGRVERDRVQVLPEQLARHVLAVADDLPDHDVRPVEPRPRVQALDRVALEPVVVVDEVDVVAAREVHAEVARPAGPARVRDVLHAHVRVLGRERIQARRRAVGRAVVDEDQLQLARRHRLAEQRADAVVEVRAGVEDRHDHADGGRGS